MDLIYEIEERISEILDGKSTVSNEKVPSDVKRGFDMKLFKE